MRIGIQRHRVIDHGDDAARTRCQADGASVDKRSAINDGASCGQGDVACASIDVTVGVDVAAIRGGNGQARGGDAGRLGDVIRSAHSDVAHGASATDCTGEDNCARTTGHAQVLACSVHCAGKAHAIAAQVAGVGQRYRAVVDLRTVGGRQSASFDRRCAGHCQAGGRQTVRRDGTNRHAVAKAVQLQCTGHRDIAAQVERPLRRCQGRVACSGHVSVALVAIGLHQAAVDGGGAGSDGQAGQRCVVAHCAGEGRRAGVIDNQCARVHAVAVEGAVEGHANALECHVAAQVHGVVALCARGRHVAVQHGESTCGGQTRQRFARTNGAAKGCQAASADGQCHIARRRAIHRAAKLNCAVAGTAQCVSRRCARILQRYRAGIGLRTRGADVTADVAGARHRQGGQGRSTDRTTEGRVAIDGQRFRTRRSCVGAIEHGHRGAVQRGVLAQGHQARIALRARGGDRSAVERRVAVVDRQAGQRRIAAHRTTQGGRAAGSNGQRVRAVYRIGECHAQVARGGQRRRSCAQGHGFVIGLRTRSSNNRVVDGRRAAATRGHAGQCGARTHIAAEGREATGVDRQRIAAVHRGHKVNGTTTGRAQCRVGTQRHSAVVGLCSRSRDHRCTDRGVTGHSQRIHASHVAGAQHHGACAIDSQVVAATRHSALQRNRARRVGKQAGVVVERHHAGVGLVARLCTAGALGRDVIRQRSRAADCQVAQVLAATDDATEAGVARDAQTLCAACGRVHGRSECHRAGRIGHVVAQSHCAVKELRAAGCSNCARFDRRGTGYCQVACVQRIDRYGTNLHLAADHAERVAGNTHRHIAAQLDLACRCRQRRVRAAQRDVCEALVARGRNHAAVDVGHAATNRQAGQRRDATDRTAKRGVAGSGGADRQGRCAVERATKANIAARRAVERRRRRIHNNVTGVGLRTRGVNHRGIATQGGRTRHAQAAQGASKAHVAVKHGIARHSAQGLASSTVNGAVKRLRSAVERRVAAQRDRVVEFLRCAGGNVATVERNASIGAGYVQYRDAAYRTAQRSHIASIHCQGVATTNDTGQGHVAQGCTSSRQRGVGSQGRRARVALRTRRVHRAAADVGGSSNCDARQDCRVAHRTTQGGRAAGAYRQRLRTVDSRCQRDVAVGGRGQDCIATTQRHSVVVGLRAGGRDVAAIEVALSAQSRRVQRQAGQRRCATNRRFKRRHATGIDRQRMRSVHRGLEVNGAATGRRQRAVRSQRHRIVVGLCARRRDHRCTDRGVTGHSQRIHASHVAGAQGYRLVGVHRQAVAVAHHTATKGDVASRARQRRTDAANQVHLTGIGLVAAGIDLVGLYVDVTGTDGQRCQCGTRTHFALQQGRASRGDGQCLGTVHRLGKCHIAGTCT